MEIKVMLLNNNKNMSPLIALINNNFYTLTFRHFLIPPLIT